MYGFTKTINKLEKRAVRNDKKVTKVEAKVVKLTGKGNAINDELNRCMITAQKMNEFFGG
jgi:hypothetical protein